MTQEEDEKMTTEQQLTMENLKKFEGSGSSNQENIFEDDHKDLSFYHTKQRNENADASSEEGSKEAGSESIDSSTSRPQSPKSGTSDEGDQEDSNESPEKYSSESEEKESSEEEREESGESEESSENDLENQNLLQKFESLSQCDKQNVVNS